MLHREVLEASAVALCGQRLEDVTEGSLFNFDHSICSALNPYSCFGLAMKSIQTTAIVKENGKLTVQVPSDIAPGEHQIVLVIDETPVVEKKRPSLKFSDYPVGLTSANFTFSREELYRDEQ